MHVDDEEAKSGAYTLEAQSLASDDVPILQALDSCVLAHIQYDP